MNKRIPYLNFCIVFFLITAFSQTNLKAQCFAGDMTSTGMVAVPDGDTFDLMMSNEMVPTGNTWCWFLDNTNSNGTGGLEQPVVITGITGMETWDNDLSGILSANGLPRLEGVWIFKGAIFTDPMDPLNSFCDVTVDSLIVEFGPVMMTTCSAGTMTTIGETTVCNGETFSVITEMTDIPTTGGLAWSFDDALGGSGGQAGGFILLNVTGNETYDSDLNGIMSGNGLDALSGTWVVKSSVYELAGNPLATVCDVSTDSLIVNFNPQINISLDNPFNTYVIADVTGGVAPYEYLWTNGETQDTVFNLEDGILTLQITDANGCMQTETITLMNTSIDEVKGLESFEISPNPSDGISHLNMTFDQAQNIEIRVLNMEGKLLSVVASEKSKGRIYPIDLSQYNSGVYLIQVITSDAKFAERIIKR